MNQEDIKKIYNDAKQDPSLFANVDIDRLLEIANDDRNDYLENKSMKDIVDEVFDTINSLSLSKMQTKELCEKLTEYRYVDRICDLHKGKHIRWIRIKGNTNEYKLTNGAVVADIKFTDLGTNILCRNYLNRFIEFKFDDCLTFQKLSSDEELILMAYHYINK
jgi:hypothetical protein